jgi:hypothetical protein
VTAQSLRAPEILLNGTNLDSHISAAAAAAMQAATNYADTLAGTAANGIYVDNLLGDDASKGGFGDPIRTLARATALAEETGAPLYLRRDRVFRESFRLPDNCVVKAYADGVRPVISGSEVLTNSLFALASGQANTYQYAISPAYESNVYSGYAHSNVLKVWDSNIRLKGGGGTATNISFVGVAAVEAAAGSAWYDSTNRLLYVHLADDANPTLITRPLEASVRTLAVHGGTNVYVEDLIAEKAYALNNEGSQGYGFLAKAQGTYKRCVGRHSWNHNIGTANYLPLPPGTELRFDSCVAYDCEEQNESSPTMFVAFKQTDPVTTNVVVFTNCYSYQPSVNTAGSVGFLAHGDSIAAWVDDCQAINVYKGAIFDGALRSRGYGFSASNTYYGAYVTAGPGLTNFASVKSGVNLVVQTTNGWYRNLRVSEATRGVSLEGTGILTNHFDDCDLRNAGNSMNGFQGVSDKYLTVSNSFFDAVRWCYYSTSWETVAQDMLLGADFNNYDGIEDRWGAGFATSPGNWFTFATWKAAFPAFDASSTQTNRTSTFIPVRTVPPAEAAGLTLNNSNIVNWAQIAPRLDLVNSITLGGVTRTNWPEGFPTTTNSGISAVGNGELGGVGFTNSVLKLNYGEINGAGSTLDIVSPRDVRLYSGTAGTYATPGFQLYDGTLYFDAAANKVMYFRTPYNSQAMKITGNGGVMFGEPVTLTNLLHLANYTNVPSAAQVGVNGVTLRNSNGFFWVTTSNTAGLVHKLLTP